MLTKKFRAFVVALDIPVLFAIFFLDDIAKYMIDYFPECFFYSNFGIECPTCGATRCVFSFFSGNFASALNYNPFIFWLIVYGILLFVFLNLSLFGLSFAEKAVRGMTNWKTVVAVAVLFVVFSVVKLIF